MVSRLVAVDGGWQRLDHHEDCPYEGDAEVLAEWKVTIEKRKKFTLSESAIWQVLSRKDDPELGEKPLTYILCLMLMRKRKLRVVKNQKVKGVEFQTYENKSRGVNLKVRVPVLGPAAFAELQEQIADFFSGDGD